MWRSIRILWWNCGEEVGRKESTAMEQWKSSCLFPHAASTHRPIEEGHLRADLLLAYTRIRAITRGQFYNRGAWEFSGVSPFIETRSSKRWSKKLHGSAKTKQRGLVHTSGTFSHKRCLVQGVDLHDRGCTRSCEPHLENGTCSNS